MKTRERLVLLMCLFVLPYSGMTQCGTIHTLTYDTTVSGGGSADPGYNFSLPKFDPTMGTLLNARIASVVTISFSYTIENRDASPGNQTTKVRVTRNDAISGPFIDTSFDFFSPQTTYSLPPSDGVSGSGPDFVRSVPSYYVLDHDTIANLTVNNTADYMGTGNVNFNYATDLGSVVTGNVNVNLLGSAHDVIKFSVSYTYCDNMLLASEITSFSASKKEGYVNLLWLTSNEIPNHTYQLEKSYDGKNFVPITTVASAPGINQIGNYEYNYVPLSNENGKLYSRIKQIGTNGIAKYSPLRMVDLGTSTENKPVIRLVPNPSKGAFSIMLSNNTVASDWNIELYNVRGQVISEKQAKNSLLTKFSMNEALSAGIYFVLVTDKKNNQKFVERLIIN